MKMKIVAGLALIFAVLLTACAENIPGVVQLNIGSFDKIISRFDAVLVKFDETYPYGDKQDAFKAVVNDALSQDKLLMAEVHVADYGEKENEELAIRYGINKDDFPAYRLFLKGQSEPVVYSGDVKNSDAIKRFLVKESGLWLGLPACIEEFDGYVKELLSAAPDALSDIVQKAKDAVVTRTNEQEEERAGIYIKYMEKIVEKGKDFITSELERVEKLQSSKVSDKKKASLKDRASILTSFALRLKDEL